MAQSEVLFVHYIPAIIVMLPIGVGLYWRHLHNMRGNKMPIAVLILSLIGLLGVALFTIVDRPSSNVEKLENDVIRICSAKGEYTFQTADDIYITCKSHKKVN